jgi:flagellin-like protein
VRRLFKDRRGVSPIFTTVLLILLVVWGMSFAFAYFINYVRDYQTGRGSAVLELICIEDVWFRDVNATAPIEVWLYNYGDIAVTVTDLYVNGQPLPFNGSDDALTIPVGGHGKLTTTPFFVFSTTSYHFRAVTQRGSFTEGEYVSPS